MRAPRLLVELDRCDVEGCIAAGAIRQDESTRDAHRPPSWWRAMRQSGSGSVSAAMVA